MYAVHVVNRPLTKNYKQLLDEVFVIISDITKTE